MGIVDGRLCVQNLLGQEVRDLLMN